MLSLTHEEICTITEKFVTRREICNSWRNLYSTRGEIFSPRTVSPGKGKIASHIIILEYLYVRDTYCAGMWGLY